MMPKMLWSLVVLCSILTVTAPARAVTCFFYQVGISGQAVDVGVQPFSVSEWVVVRVPGVTDPTTRESNPVEVFITNFPNQVSLLGSGDIKSNAYPVGSIELMTNSLYANNRGVRESRTHLADVKLSQPQNPSGLLVEFQLNGRGIPGQTDPGGLLLSPNAVKVPGQGSAIAALPSIAGGLSALTNFFGAFSPSGAISVLNSYVLVPIQGAWVLFFTSTDSAAIPVGIHVLAMY